MLILTRRISETLVIITMLATKGNQIRCGIEAPKDISVYREEIHQRILKEEQYRQGILLAQPSYNPTFGS